MAKGRKNKPPKNPQAPASPPPDRTKAAAEKPPVVDRRQRDAGGHEEPQGGDRRQRDAGGHEEPQGGGGHEADTGGHERVPDRDEATAPTERAVPGWFLPALLAVCAIGTAASVYLTHLHVVLFYGKGVSESLCDFGSSLSCTTVNGSDYSTLFGVPVAMLGPPAFAAAAMLGWRASKRGRTSAEMSLVFGVGALSTAFCAYLLYVSSVVLGAWCLFCLTIDAASLAVLALPVAVDRGVARRLLDVLDRPSRAWGEAFTAGVAVLGLLWGFYAADRSSAIAASTEAALAPTSGAIAGATAKPASSAVKTSTDVPQGADTAKLRVMADRASLTVPKGAPSLGPADAPVQIVEFADFQCPFCKRLAGTLHELHDEYPTQVHVSFLQFPMNLDCNGGKIVKTLHPEACRASAAAICAGKQGKFFEAHDLLFQSQAQLGEPLYRSLPDRIGLDASAFDACRESPGITKEIQDQSRIGGDAGVNGTPNLFVNGRSLAGSQPIEVLRAVVDAELKHTDGVLDIEVPIGSEKTGQVKDAAPTVDVTVGEHAFAIDAFEDAVVDGKGVSQAGQTVSNAVSWYEAKAACEAAGKRLCTEEEWLTACMGAQPVDEDEDGTFSNDPPTGRFYAYGSLYREGVCADRRHEPGQLIAGNHPDCVTPDGVYDLHGNVKEWVGLDASQAAVMGGSYASEEAARCTFHKADIPPDTHDPTIGFRCCQGEAPAQEDLSRFTGGKVGDKLKDFTLASLEQDGATFDSKTLAGHPAIVTFWASWCGPCRHELPVLVKMYDKYKAMGLEVLGISIDTETPKAKAFLKQMPLPFHVAIDPKEQVKSGFQVDSIPTTFWIRPDGTIRLRTVGFPGGGEQQIEQWVTDLLNDQGK